MKRAETLWSPGAKSDRLMLDYTVGDDREVDARLLRWDVIGSLGHLESLARGRIVSPRQRGAMRRALVAALSAVESGQLTIGTVHEDVHSAVEFWLTQHFGDSGERIHTGRSRNDQVAVDLRLYLKDAVLELHTLMTGFAATLLAFARKHRRVVWPGYTHQRIAMPSSAGAWAAAYAEGLLDAADSVLGFWARLDRSPLGSAAGYGVPLRLNREAAAHALGFRGVDQVVTTTQNARGVLEAQVLFWCLGAAHECAKLSTDVILFSADEFGWLSLPAEWSTGSSIMPQKRNPDLFELTRGRSAALEGDLATVMALKAKLAGGYHRDFQLLKAPLWRGIDRTRELLTIVDAVMPHVRVDAARGLAALRPEVFATDEVMRRMGTGTTFRRAYREVADAFRLGAPIPPVSAKAIAASRTSTGGLGNLPLPALARRLRISRNWCRSEQRRFNAAISRLVAVRRR
jgi:argininosuccinate lyase